MHREKENERWKGNREECLPGSNVNVLHCFAQVESIVRVADCKKLIPSNKQKLEGQFNI